MTQVGLRNVNFVATTLVTVIRAIKFRVTPLLNFNTAAIFTVELIQILAGINIYQKGSVNIITGKMFRQGKLMCAKQRVSLICNGICIFVMNHLEFPSFSTSIK